MEDLNIPIYAATLGAALLLMQALLMMSVGLYRAKAGKGVGVDGDMALERQVRRHGNLAENAAIFIVVLTLYELIFGQTPVALITAGVFFAARWLHILGFSSNAGSHLVGVKEGQGRPFVLMRMFGSGLTALTSLVLGGTLLVGLILSA
ncbi:MAG: MAPEG family protein [Henriciella sp.]|nr:MAPEG family protein [Hyphomonadaceae bacterium]